MTDQAGAGPFIPVSKERAKTRALAELRQDIWEVSQFTTAPMIREYVESVLREVESDEP